MKNISLLLIAFSLLVAIGCNKDEKLTSFQFTQDYEFTMSEDSISVDTTIAITSTDIKSLLKEYSEANNSLLELVQELELVSIKIEAVDPSTQTLGFLEDGHIYISSGSLAELMIASKDPVPTSTGTILDFDVQQDVGVLQYLKNTNFKFRIALHQRSTLPQATKMKITGTFKAVAGVKS